MRVFIVLLFAWMNLQAQLPEQFLLFGDPGSNNRGSASVVFPDHSLVFCGTATIWTDDICLTRISAEGETEWTVFHGTNDDEFVNNMIAVGNDKLAICGDATNSLSDQDGFLMLVDTAGEFIWRVDHGISDRNEDFYGICEASNGDILVCGFITGMSGVGNDLLVVRYDTLGNELWRANWGESVNDYAMGICESPGGTIFVSADRYIDGIGYNALVAALDPDGELLWEMPVDLPYNSGCKTLRMNSQGKLMMTGESATAVSALFDILLVQIDTSGAVDWVEWLGDAIGGEAGYDLTEAADGSYFISGFGYNAATANNDILVVHAAADGSELGRHYYGDLLVDYAYDIQTDDAGNYWVSGFSNQAGITYFALVRNSFVLTDLVQEESATGSLLVYPNPAYGEASVQLPYTGSGMLQMYDPSGRLVMDQFIPAGTGIYSLNMPYAGLWSIRWLTDQGKVVSKVLSLE